MGVGETFGEAFAKAQLAAGSPIPNEGALFVSVNDRDKPAAAEVAKRFHEYGFDLYATRRTAAVLRAAGLPVKIVFKVNEGPKVKVGQITFEGNDHETPLALHRAMKNLHAYGIPYSIFFEDLIPKTYDSTKLEEDQERIQQFYQDNGYFTAHTTGAKVDIVNSPLCETGTLGFERTTEVLRRWNV